MRITSDSLPAPRCLQAFDPRRVPADAKASFIDAFMSEEEDARARAHHLSLGRPEEEWVSIREEVEAWSFGCACGSREGKIFGVRIDDQFHGPLRFVCAACQATAPLFDKAVDGWKAETSKRKAKPKKEPKTTFALYCKGCKNNVWEPTMLAAYQGDLSGVAEETRANHFDHAAFGGRCKTCKKLSLGYTEELALRPPADLRRGADLAIQAPPPPLSSST